MQLWAKDKNNNLVFVQDASRFSPYYCTECGGIVRRRRGRRWHYYHEKSDACRQGGKSAEHLEVQLYLSKLIRGARIEVKIGDRIADILIPHWNLVIEIQCSPISVEEVRERNRDYATRGLTIIWILHIDGFHSSHCIAEELLGKHFYFTNMNKEGVGIIYDYFPGKMVMPVHLETRLAVGELTEDFPSLAWLRKEHWPFHFDGDIISIWKKEQVGHNTLLHIGRKIRHAFRIVLHRALEHSCQ